MLRHQNPEGNFDYEYDWREASYSPDDNEVRQAGALWGLALLYQHRPTAELAAAVEKGLAFFESHAKQNSRGMRCVGYPGKSAPGIGTVALVALTYIENLSAQGGSIAPDRRALHETRLTGYLAMLRQGLNRDGLWYGGYDPATCSPSGAPSPYSDGEALLTLVKAAKYAGHGELEDLALRAADDGYLHNVKEALASDRDSDTTKGYYQWSSMAFYELATSGWPGVDRFVPRVFELADWQIDVHQTLTRVRNTGYAYEGLIPSFDLARRRGDKLRSDKYACVIDLGLERLVSWQVGGPLATPYTGASGSDDPEAIGGVQNERHEPGLRIDVTQHQMHATIFALDLVYR
jgi:UDP-N-acetylmuramoyl-tripeptide--D-alanyl-D-alanine ligase